MSDLGHPLGKRLNVAVVKAFFEVKYRNVYSYMYTIYLPIYLFIYLSIYIHVYSYSYIYSYMIILFRPSSGRALECGYC